METNQEPVIVALWMKNEITEAVMEFTAGGDSMGDTTWQIFKNGKVLKHDDDSDITTIVNYLDWAVYNKVNFYVNSDGEYMGEFGSVYVYLSDDKTYFNYSKVATAEYSNLHQKNIIVDLPDKLKSFVEEYIDSFHFEDWDEINFRYKKDLIIDDNVTEIETELNKLLGDKADEVEFDDVDGECDDNFFRFYSEEIVDGKINLAVERRFNLYVDSQN